mmetsp:Transcript_9286/g.56534  ORF Transcript_9286/g.56534 Transcript_9286/m.56534 type:complete len:269 (-) Transcript_9286:952-1758(-)
MRRWALFSCRRGGCHSFMTPNITLLCSWIFMLKQMHIAFLICIIFKTCSSQSVLRYCMMAFLHIARGRFEEVADTRCTLEVFETSCHQIQRGDSKCSSFVLVGPAFHNTGRVLCDHVWSCVSQLARSGDVSLQPQCPLLGGLRGGTAFKKDVPDPNCKTCCHAVVLCPVYFQPIYKLAAQFEHPLHHTLYVTQTMQTPEVLSRYNLFHSLPWSHRIIIHPTRESDKVLRSGGAEGIGQGAFRDCRKFPYSINLKILSDRSTELHAKTP